MNGSETSVRRGWIQSDEQADEWLFVAKDLLATAATDREGTPGSNPELRKTYINVAVLVLDLIQAWHQEREQQP